MEPTSNMLPLFGSLKLRDCFDKPNLDDKLEEKFNSIQLICLRTLEALNAFRQKNFICFDALVGDQACQIRALKIALISDDNIDFEINSIKNFKTEIEYKLETNAKIKKNLRAETDEKIKNNPLKKVELNKQFREDAKVLDKQIRDGNNLFVEKLLNRDVFVKKDTLFIARAYFLTITKKLELIPEKNTYKNLTKESLLQIQNLNCKKILDKAFFVSLKTVLAEESVNFVKDLANEIKFTKCLESKLGKNKRMELPFVYMTEVIFKSAYDIPILLKIKNIKEKAFVCNIPFGKFEKDSVGIIIESFSAKSSVELCSNEFKDTLLKEGILSIIQYNTAQHNQYTNQENFDDNQKELKVKAIEKGFSLSNPSICCIDHVFCDLMGNQMKDKS